MVEDAVVVGPEADRRWGEAWRRETRVEMELVFVGRDLGYWGQSYRSSVPLEVIRNNLQ